MKHQRSISHMFSGDSVAWCPATLALCSEIRRRFMDDHHWWEALIFTYLALKRKASSQNHQSIKTGFQDTGSSTTSTHTHTHGYCALRVPESDPGCLHAHTYTHANTHIYYVRTRIDVSLNLNIVLNMNPKSRCKPFKPEGLNQSEEGRPRMI